MYRTAGWESPNERQIREEELSVREEVSKRIQELKQGVHQRQRKEGGGGGAVVGGGGERIGRLDPRGPGSGNRGRSERDGTSGDWSSSDGSSPSLLSSVQYQRQPEHEKLYTTKQTHVEALGRRRKELEREHWSPTKGWNSSVSIVKKRRPTLRHTIFDVAHSTQHPYQPKAFNPLPAAVHNHSVKKKSCQREIDQRVRELEEYEWQQQQQTLGGGGGGGGGSRGGGESLNNYTTFTSSASNDNKEHAVLERLGLMGSNMMDIQKIANSAAGIAIATPPARRRRRKDPAATPWIKARSPNEERERLEIALAVEKRVEQMQMAEAEAARRNGMMKQQQDVFASQQSTRGGRSRRRSFRESRIKKEERHVYDEYEKMHNIQQGGTPWTNGLRMNEITQWVERGVDKANGGKIVTDADIIQRLGGVEKMNTSQRRGSFFGGY